MTSTSNQRPIVQLLDILGKKWILRILWELDKSPCTFRELQNRCGDLSPTIINSRIKDLCSAQLIFKSAEEGYMLSQQGNKLVELFYPLNDFAKQWIEFVDKNAD
ncbi:MAG: helix-turn-helix transcriptional regulator [Sneathiella sp.]|nr:helix-turn-helix transcriptional regulator [Sneathiella sp.]